MSEIFRCPVDEHICQIPDCAKNKDLPRCEDAIKRLSHINLAIRDLLFLAGAGEQDYDIHMDSLKNLIPYIALQTGLDPKLFQQRLSDQIDTDFNEQEG